MKTQGAGLYSKSLGLRSLRSLGSLRTLILRQGGQKKRANNRSLSYGWVSYLHRAATTDYLCCGQALEDSPGAGRIGLTHIRFYKFQNEKQDISCLTVKKTGLIT